VYDNNPENLQEETESMRTWDYAGSLGVLIGIIAYIKTPQQHDLLNKFQRLANDKLPTNKKHHYSSQLNQLLLAGTRFTLHSTALLSYNPQSTHIVASILSALGWRIRSVAVVLNNQIRSLG
jgi:hypothetical protein